MPGHLVYYFGGGEAEGSRELKALLGSKGANLAEMTRLGIPVPPGFTITTEACRHYQREHELPDGLLREVHTALQRVEAETGKRFGGGGETGAVPLLVSVRSGAAISMPGMMDTVLNLGLTDATAEALARAAGNPRFAYDSYRRFIQMYGEVVLRIPAQRFEAVLDGLKEARGVVEDTALDADDLRELVREFKKLVAEATGAPFPEDPEAQLRGAIEAVFRSWENDRAIAYRRVHGIPNDLGTGVTIMAMVYGNMGEDSGTGVAFTRDPGTGERRLFGEFLSNAQGEDVVAGTRDPLPIDQMATRFPAAFQELERLRDLLERHYHEMQDLEFTIERGKLYMLQTRTGKRTAAAAVRIAVEMVGEGLIDEAEAVRRIAPDQLNRLLHRQVDPSAEVQLLTTGLPASPGAASGRVVFDPAEAVTRGSAGEAVILVRRETSPDDFEAMVAARAILTTRGGITSHAAVVARGMGKCCIVGAGAIRIDEGAGWFQAGETVVRAGEWITLDGGDGRVLLGEAPTVEPEPGEEFHRLMEWADAFRRLGVRANADTPEDAARARSFGAEGIGLCRTEHMFFDGERLAAVRELILAPDAAVRERALATLLPMQRGDFEGIFRAMDGLPVTVRLLDPPLHEFLPRTEEEVRQLAERVGVDEATLAAEVERHHEANPMLGHRGVRVGISHPEITAMQARAIFEAAINVSREGIVVHPEIMVPLIATEAELSRQRALIEEVAQEVLTGADLELRYLIGTMIELPRAALTAGEIAKEADFFSFGTNDLTQTTFGISRDDSASFLPRYIEEGILADDPFQVLDQEGVGRLVEIATREGRATKPTLKVGICGEHGGEPRSVEFFHRTDLDYVSCSPYRVPVARLAAAQAVLRERQATTSTTTVKGKGAGGPVAGIPTPGASGQPQGERDSRSEVEQPHPVHRRPAAAPVQ
jgi:pyruvate,orthophosphate dikinase